MRKQLAVQVSDHACLATAGVDAARAAQLITSLSEVCSDEKVANREIRVWHFVIENGY